MKKAISILFLVAASIATSLEAQPVTESFFDQKKKEVICAEQLPIFTLGEQSNPSKCQL